MNDPNDMLLHIKPFFPNDPSLAKSAVSKLLPAVPQWVVEMIVYEMFTALSVQREYKEYLRRHTQYNDRLIGPSKDLDLPSDLSHVFNWN